MPAEQCSLGDLKIISKIRQGIIWRRVHFLTSYGFVRQHSALTGHLCQKMKRGVEAEGGIKGKNSIIPPL